MIRRSTHAGRSARRVLALPAVLLTGLLLAGCGGGGGGGDETYKEPTGAATETISISAKNFSFTPDDVKADAGIAKIELTSTGGLHDLVFDGDFPGFRIEVESGETKAKKVELEPGEYTFYCSLPGHRQQGMEGTITVK